MKLRKVRLIVLAAIALASHCNAAVIALPNASFESPDFTDGSGLAHIDPGLVFGWNWTGPVNNTQFGIIDPNDFRFLGTTGNGVNRLPSPAEGYQYAFLGGSAQSVSSIQNPAPLATNSTACAVYSGYSRYQRVRAKHRQRSWNTSALVAGRTKFGGEFEH